MDADEVAVAVVVGQRPGLVERDPFGVLVMQPFEVRADVLGEEVLGEDPYAADGEGDRPVVVHPEVRGVEGEIFPNEMSPSFPVVAELLVHGRDDREVLGNPDEDLAVRQELAAGGPQGQHVLEQRDLDVALELADPRVVADLDDVVAGVRLAEEPADLQEVLVGPGAAEPIPVALGVVGPENRRVGVVVW